ncbi:hypothetical protein GGR34_000190 [Microvirga flocculans]|uniref:Stress-induced protein n=1 Tax=Microvirga flocculans TaxID=217168 RepID=A0A7W6ICC6_9HYPH|nr:KGG domain-containing protein [Microvirga flocculans]MBB4038561.1 hypothetical protein [Microvirga flocculans]
MAQNKSGGSNRGFSSMDESKQREIAKKGGEAGGGSLKNTPEKASEAGRKGGEHSHGGGRGR